METEYLTKTMHSYALKLKAQLALQEGRATLSQGETGIGHAIRLVEESQDVLVKALDKKVSSQARCVSFILNLSYIVWR